MPHHGDRVKNRDVSDARPVLRADRGAVIGSRDPRSVTMRRI
jgi:hypothetical protein